ncbi:hypothetical protein ACP70R_013162 [Stipagrostis hirtigluma subsp. patula]
MRSEGCFKFMLLLITLLLLGAELAGLCHGRGIPSAEVVMVHEVESPPGEGYYLLPNKQRSPWSWRRRRGGVRRHDRRVQDLSESKRVVPQGPNPLHN